MVLAFALGLAVNYRFRKETSEKPDPNNLRQGDRLTVEYNPETFANPTRRSSR